MLQADLKVLGGKFQGKLIPLNTKKFLVGREQDCHLRPNSDMVSRHHCIFLVDDFTVRLRDLGSTNGTRVNGELVRHELVLNDGDKITIGKLELQLAIRSMAPVAAAVPAGATPAESPSGGYDIPVDSASTDTNFNLNAPTDSAGVPTMTNLAGDTAIHGVPPGAPAEFPPPGYGYPAGMPMPGYPPGYPAYPPAGYPYPVAPPPAGMYPGYPGYAMPGAPAGPASPAAATVTAPPVRLPLPQDTGYREQAAPPPPPPSAEGAPAAPPASSPDKSSNSAADIIKQYMQRRGGR
jgi:pSer/pThr/pTyr-binding forkhead associated (FHA) protein